MSLASYRLRGQPQQKIRPEHLDRAAIVYVRQSSRQQVLEHTESTRLQYALAGRAAGWRGRRGRSGRRRLGRRGLRCRAR